MIIQIQLTPVGHYFLGGERGFGYDKNLNRLQSDSYYISSLKVPSQTTLFGALRYILGVKEEKLRENAENLIGDKSFNLTDTNEEFGIIKSISPLYLYNENTYYIRTPFDHVVASYEKETENGKEKTKKTDNTVYTPFEYEEEEIEVVTFPSDKIGRKDYPSNFNAKDGVAKSYMSLTDKTIVGEDDIFESSVEVVSKKNKESDSKDAFAKKEYMRLKKEWSFVYFAEIDAKEVPEYNTTVVLGKDTSAFSVSVTEGSEPDLNDIFRDRGKEFHYFQSPFYIRSDTNKLIENSTFSVLNGETIRCFMTKGSKLIPDYDNQSLIQLISAGSVIVTDDVSELENKHAMIAGFNKMISGWR